VIDVPDDQLDAAMEAELSCPEQAPRLIRDA
jgi:hypothetical protein